MRGLGGGELETLLTGLLCAAECADDDGDGTGTCTVVFTVVVTVCCGLLAAELLLAAEWCEATELDDELATSFMRSP